MVVWVIILSLLTAQTSGSLFNDFKDAMSSVQSSLGTLVTDVASDVKNTFDCTVHAVEEVIYSSDETEYYEKCHSKDNKVVSPKKGSQMQPIQIIITAMAAPVASDNNNIENKEIVKKLENVEEALKDETNMLANMSSNMEHEFEYLSNNINNELKRIEDEERELALQKSLHEIEMLRLEEEIHKDVSREEIQKIFDELLIALKSSQNESDLESEIRDIIQRLENNSSKTILEELEKWKEKEIEYFEYLKNKSNSNIVDPQNDTSTSLSTTVAATTVNGTEELTPTSKATTTTELKTTPTTNIPTSTSPTTISSTSNSPTTSSPTTTSLTTNLPTSTPPTTISPITTSENSRLSRDINALIPKNKTEAVDQAKKLINDTKKKKSFMESLFKNLESATNLFEHPELLW